MTVRRASSSAARRNSRAPSRAADPMSPPAARDQFGRLDARDSKADRCSAKPSKLVLRSPRAVYRRGQWQCWRACVRCIVAVATSSPCWRHSCAMASARRTRRQHERAFAGVLHRLAVEKNGTVVADRNVFVEPLHLRLLLARRIQLQRCRVRGQARTCGPLAARARASIGQSVMRAELRNRMIVPVVGAHLLLARGMIGIPATARSRATPRRRRAESRPRRCCS